VSRVYLRGQDRARPVPTNKNGADDFAHPAGGPYFVRIRLKIESSSSSQIYTPPGAMKVFIFIMLGGFVGLDGYVVSPGILLLAHRLGAFGDVSTYNWSSVGAVTERIASLDPNDKVVLIGYSGGGFAITHVAENLNRNPSHRIDLLIAYDPSPTWSMKSIGKNVVRAICYCNDNPLFLGMGGAKLTGSASVEVVPISEPHPVVQFDESLHKKTLAEVEKLAGGGAR
jgi:hypothetical protein